MLSVRDLHVYYGSSHALQGVDLSLSSGIHAVVGRNGMGKTTLCNTIMGLISPGSGSIRLDGREISGLKSHEIALLGAGYTPQGRRLWPSLTVDEHLQMCQRRGASWTVERIYETFPRLAERRNNGGAQLSGGEQQMLAIGRTLLQDPHLLVLDEPTEGLAPVIVTQVEELLLKLADSEGVAILLVEQNIGVATRVADDIAIMVNGQITSVMDAATLGADRALQQQLLGVGRVDESAMPAPAPSRKDDRKSVQPSEAELAKTTGAIDGAIDSTASDDNSSDETTATSYGYLAPTRWSKSSWDEQQPQAVPQTSAAPIPVVDSSSDVRPLYGESVSNKVLVAGTFDTKTAELAFICERLRSHGVKVSTVDLSTSGKPSSANVPPHVIAASHPGGSSAVFSGDRGSSITAMANAFKQWISDQPDIAGIISAGGSGGTALATPAMQTLPIEIPKVMISTVASGNVAPYVGPTNIMMMYSVTDIQGINSVTRTVLGTGADALFGMLTDKPDPQTHFTKAAIGLSMFGVTTPAVQQITAELDTAYDCLVFHATGVGGQSMEKLADSGMLVGAIDLTTTEVCDLLVGGVFAATEDRFGAFIRSRIPYVGSVGAVDMVNFGARNTVPEKFSNRTFVEHNAQVTLMRTSVEENARIGKWIGEKLNAMEGQVRFFIPEGGVSALDMPDQPFYDPEANAALFSALTDTVVETPNRKIIKHSDHINDQSFTADVVKTFNAIMPPRENNNHATN